MRQMNTAGIFFYFYPAPLQEKKPEKQYVFMVLSGIINYTG